MNPIAFDKNRSASNTYGGHDFGKNTRSPQSYDNSGKYSYPKIPGKIIGETTENTKNGQQQQSETQKTEKASRDGVNLNGIEAAPFEVVTKEQDEVMQPVLTNGQTFESNAESPEKQFQNDQDN